MLTKQERAVLAVLAYSAQFEHPLSKKEIISRMLKPKGFERLDGWLVSGRSVAFSPDTLKSLKRKKKIIVSPKKIAGELRYSLPGFEQSFNKLKKALILQRKKQGLIKDFLKVVKMIPWVRAVAITGSLGAGGGKVHDDVDFLIVTQKGRLWLTRLVLLFISMIKGRRPHLGKDISKSWDLNLWLDEDRLKIDKRRRFVYEAYEILQTNWIYDRDKVERRFYQANEWVGDILLNWNEGKGRVKVKSKQKITSGLLNEIMIFFNKLAFYLEIGYRTIKHGKQQATLDSAFFHNKNTRGSIFKAWKKLYNQACR